MYLYDKNENNIDVYSFEADIKRLKDYRENLLKGKKLCDIFYILETTDKTIMNKFVKGDKIDVNQFKRGNKLNSCDSVFVNYPENYYSLKTNEILHHEIINNYINGEYTKKIPTTVFQKEDGDESFVMDYLTTKDSIQVSSKTDKKTYYRLDDIIKLPSELCILQLLENGRFDQVLNSRIDFSEQIKLFDIQQIKTISEDVIREMCTYNLINENYKEIDRKINTTQKILKKMNDKR